MESVSWLQSSLELLPTRMLSTNEVSTAEQFIAEQARHCLLSATCLRAAKANMAWLCLLRECGESKTQHDVEGMKTLEWDI